MKNDSFDPLNSNDLGTISLTLLNERQFTSEDVTRVLGITDKQLEHAIDPKRAVVRLTVHETARIRGLRRLFSGGDVLALATVFAANSVGFPMRFMQVLAESVDRRAMTLCPRKIDLTPDFAIATWPMKSGDDWAVAHLHANRDTEPKLPVACIVIDIDRLIRETVAKLEAVIEGSEIPNFDVPDPVPEPSPYSPENDFFLAWMKDETGRDCRVGLTHEETVEFEALVSSKTHEMSDAASEREDELRTRHEAARMRRIGEHLNPNPDRPS